MRSRTGGFTLVEVLVVIAITAMISVVVLQMLTILLRGYEQVGSVQADIALDTMRFGWFRESISLMAASLDEEFAFKGDSKTISGFTLAPLGAEAGKLTRVEWELRESSGGQSLWYREANASPMRIGEWQDTTLRFAYRGQKSGWLNEWPSGDLPAGVLPHRVKLTMSGAEKRELYAAVNIRRTGRYDYRDFL